MIGVKGYRSSFFLLFDRHENKILTMPRCLFVWLEADIKGRAEKHQSLDLSTQTRAFVSD